MPYRFTDTEKWTDPWFRKLSPGQKLAFLYLSDNCDCAGFWEVDLEMMAFMIKVDENACEGAISVLDKAIVMRDGWIWVRNFIKHQKNLQLNWDNKAHRPIITRLQSHVDIFPEVSFLLEETRGIEGASKGLPSPPGKGKGKGKGRGKGTGKSKSGSQTDEYTEQFNEWWEKAEVKIGKAKAFEAFQKIKTGFDDDALDEMIKKYNAYIAANLERDANWSPIHMSSWLNQKRWEDDEPLFKSTMRGQGATLPDGSPRPLHPQTGEPMTDAQLTHLSGG
jgi:hypothetical protein